VSAYQKFSGELLKEEDIAKEHLLPQWREMVGVATQVVGGQVVLMLPANACESPSRRGVGTSERLVTSWIRHHGLRNVAVTLALRRDLVSLFGW
jgi:hypothetical protein